MNKNHLLPSLLFVLAACGGAASSSSLSSSSSQSASTSTSTTEVDSADWYLIGNVTDPIWTPGLKTYPLTLVSGQTGVYEVTIALGVDDEFKVKTGAEWNQGRDIGFDRTTAAAPGTFIAGENGNIKATASGTFRVVFTFAASAGTIVISPTGWIGYGSFGINQGSTSTSISYIGPDPFYNESAQLRLASAFDGANEGIEFAFTGKTDDTYLFKAEGPNGVAKESAVVATGSEQTFILSLANLTEAQRDTINLFILFSQTAGSEGTIVISGWDYVASVEPTAPEWVAVGSTVVMDGDDMTMTYSARANFWDQHAKIELVNFDGSNTSASVTFIGEVGQDYIFKFEYPGQTNNMEFTFTATGSEQTVTIDLSQDKNDVAITEAIRDSFNLFVVFSATPSDAGSITVKPLSYTA
jgi:hypothetical protein